MKPKTTGRKKITPKPAGTPAGLPPIPAAARPLSADEISAAVRQGMNQAKRDERMSGCVLRIIIIIVTFIAMAYLAKVGAKYW